MLPLSIASSSSKLPVLSAQKQKSGWEEQVTPGREQLGHPPSKELHPNQERWSKAANNEQF